MHRHRWTAVEAAALSELLELIARAAPDELCGTVSGLLRWADSRSERITLLVEDLADQVGSWGHPSQAQTDWYRSSGDIGPALVAIRRLLREDPRTDLAQQWRLRAVEAQLVFLDLIRKTADARCWSEASLAGARMWGDLVGIANPVITVDADWLA